MFLRNETWTKNQQLFDGIIDFTQYLIEQKDSTLFIKRQGSTLNKSQVSQLLIEGSFSIKGQLISKQNLEKVQLEIFVSRSTDL